MNRKKCTGGDRLVGRTSTNLPVLLRTRSSGSNLDIDEEKALLTLGSKTLLERALDTVSGLNKEYRVVVTSKTPKTKEYCKDRSIPHIETEGEGYVDDSIELYQKFGPFISLAVDMPFLKPHHISRIEEEFNGGSVTAVVKHKEAAEMIESSSSINYQGEEVVPVCLNVFQMDWGEKILPFSEPELALNIDSLESKRKAESLLNGENG